MYLTRQEQDQLKKTGYSTNDIHEIQIGIRKTTYALVTPDGQQLPIPESEAVDRLGREAWVKAVSKSAFDMFVTVIGLNEEKIRLHTKNYL